MPISLICEVCGDPFTDSPSRSARQYCSRTCKGLAWRKPDRLSDDLLRAKLEAHSTPIPFSGCWIWLGQIAMPQGYGRIYVGGGRAEKRHQTYTHIVSYELQRGPVPAGHELDHLCRVRLCWNPEHLEAVTHTINVQRGDAPTLARVLVRDLHHARRTQTHCKHGHEFTPENTYIIPTTGSRQCRTCARAGQTERRFPVSSQRIV